MTNKEIMTQIGKLISEKNYSQNELFDLFSKMTKKAQDNVNGVVDNFKKEG